VRTGQLREQSRDSSEIKTLTGMSAGGGAAQYTMGAHALLHRTACSHRGYTSIRRVWCDAEALAEVDAELGKETNASELLEAQVRQPVTSSESPQALLLYQCAS
jgi:hypothetical protein